MSRDDVLWEAEQVRSGRLNLNECNYPDEVEAELGAMNIDSYGNYIRSQPNWNQMNNNNNRQQYKEDEKEFDKMCCCILLILIIFAAIIAI